MKATQSRLLSSLLAVAAPAAVPFVPRRQFYKVLRDVQRTCVRVHPFSSMDLDVPHLTWLALPEEMRTKCGDIGTMQWVIDNQDHCFSRIGV